MTRQELKQLLDLEGFKPLYYSLDDDAVKDEAFHLYNAAGRWFIDYFEHGQSRPIDVFDTEDEACHALHRMLSKDAVIAGDRKPGRADG